MAPLTSATVSLKTRAPTLRALRSFRACAAACDLAWLGRFLASVQNESWAVPAGVAVSSSRSRAVTRIPRASRSRIVFSVSTVVRPRRSSRVTHNVSPSRRYATAAASPGRSAFAPEATSVNTRSHPPASSSRDCARNDSTCAGVDTRA